MIRLESIYRTLGRACVVFTFAIGVMSVSACSDEACDAAVVTMRACLDKLDCNNVDPLQRTKCTNAKSQGETAVRTMDGVPCVAEASDIAEQINKCNPNPATYCRCQ